MNRWLLTRPHAPKATRRPTAPVLTLTPLEDRVVPVAGALDLTFNGTGSTTIDYGNDDQARAVLVQPDGKVVAVGSWDGGSSDFAIARYNPDGTPDGTFSTDGKNTFNIGNADFATGAALQADGKIVVVGYSDAFGATNDFAVIRINADGSKDGTFNGGTGVLSVNFGNDDRASGVALQVDGKIIVVGSWSGGSSDFAIIRVNTDGTLDGTFAPGSSQGGGKQNVFFGASIGAGQEFATGVAVRPDGRIVVGGYTNLNGGATSDFAVAQLTANGILDTTFGTGGKATVDFAGVDDKANAVLIQPDGMIVLAGTVNPPAADFGVARFKTDGTLDTGFNTTGKSTFGLGNNEVGTAIAIQPDGRLIMGGFSDSAGTNDFAVIRINTNGTQDNTVFAGGGNGARFSFGGDERAFGVALRQDGKIVVAGTTSVGGAAGNPNNFLTVQLTAEGAVDKGFNGTGKTTTDFTNTDTAKAVLVQPDGKIVAVGSRDGGSANFALARYNPDGTLDTTFDTDGKVDVTLGGADFATGAALQADGKIVVVGYSDAFGATNDFAVIRINADGSKDGTFNGGTGVLSVNFGNDDRASGVALQVDGKIIVVGSWSGGSSDFAIIRVNTDGTLDGTFAPGSSQGGGKQNVFFGASIGAGQEFATGVAVRPDGRIVVGGYTNLNGGATSDFAVAQLTANGILDTTFGTGGKATVDFAGVDDKANAVLIQPDGMIVLAGTVNPPAADFGVARFKTDGTLDTGFNTTGKSTFGLGNNEVGTAIAIQPDGRLIMGGFSDSAGTNDFAVIRINTNGTQDNTVFAGGSSGARVDFGGDDKAYAVALQSDGKIVVAGITGTDFAVARLEGDTVNLGVTVSNGVTTVGVGNPTTYTITVTNTGPNTATGVSVGDTIPAGLTNVTFTSVAAGGATGNTVAGNGAIANTVTLPSGASVTYTVSATIAEGASGTITLTATAVTLTGVSEYNQSDNTASDTDTINVRPTISDVTNQATNVGVAVGPLGFTVGDAETAAAALAVTATSANTTLVPNANIVIAGAGANRTVTVTPAAGQTGTATITLTVTDGFGLTATDTFVVTVVTATIRSSAGANPASIQAAVDAFRADLGTLNANKAGSFANGRREINWDGVPDAKSAPNNLPADFFNTTSPRGAVFSFAGGSTGTGFQVSANAANPPVRFGNLNAQYPTIFQTFSAERLFTSLGSNAYEVRFFVPGTTIPATVSGFGAVFVDVDNPGSTIEYFDAAGKSLGSFQSQTADNGLSFVGVNFTQGERVARVVVTAGNTPIGAADAPGVDVAVFDDFIYSEPQAITNSNPTITDVTNQTTTVGTAVGPLTFTIGDAETAATGLVVTGTSSNAALVPNANIVISGTDANRTVTVTPAAGQAGTTTITVTVTDLNGGTATDTFTVTVTNTNPTITDITNQTTPIGIPVGPLAFTVGDAETAAAALTVTGTSSNAALVPNANIVVTGTGANRTVTITPAAGQAGTATITLTVTDANGGTATDTFTVLVSTNTNPTISAIGNQTVIVGTALAPATITVGDAETPAGTLVLSATSSNTALVPVANVVFTGAGATRTVTVTPVAGQLGTATITVTVTDANGGLASSTFTVTVNPIPSVLIGFQQFAVGPDRGSPPNVTLFNADKSVRLTNMPFDATFTGGVRTASADFNADGVADLVVGTGPGRATRVIVLDGITSAQLFSIDPFESAFTGGVYVAAGDLNGDGIADLVITPDEGGGPRARVFSGKGFGQLADFFGIEDTNFRGGARPAIGDITGDGKADLVIAAGFGGGPRVAVFSGVKLAAEGGLPDQTQARWNTWKPFGDFLTFEPELRNGAFVAAGDVNGDGFAELIAGGGPGGGPRVRAFNGLDLLSNKQTAIADFFGGDVNNRGGVRVSVKNLDGDNQADVVIGSGTGAGSRVTAYAGKSIASPTPPELFAIDAIPGFTGGVFVG